MRVIEKHIVESVPWNNSSKEYDMRLSGLCTDGSAFLVINPLMDYDVLSLITIPLPENDCCIKLKIGDGWVAKRFPANWNGRYQVVNLPITILEQTCGKLVTPIEFIPDAWEFNYSHAWMYNDILSGGIDKVAITINFVKDPVETKYHGFAPVQKIDVIFMSYGEDDADANWQRLLTKAPHAQRVTGVKGIMNAHKAAAKLSKSDVFYVVDADAWITDDFEFNFIPTIFDADVVHVWHSLNPVNGLEYGYGGVKMFPKDKLLEAADTVIDVTTSIGGLKVMEQVACETRFNTDPFNTWKSAFRECVKLSSTIIVNQNRKETEYRLQTWNAAGHGSDYGKYALSGAIMGTRYGANNIGNLEKLARINDYNWLHEQFEKHYG